MNAQEQVKERHSTLLRRYLEQSGIKQQELAQKLGIKAPNITDWLSKKRPVPVRRARKLSRLPTAPFAAATCIQRYLTESARPSPYPLECKTLCERGLILSMTLA